MLRRTAPPSDHKRAAMMRAGRNGLSSPRGRLAQLVRAPALQAGSRGFESLTAHHSLVSVHPKTSNKQSIFSENTGDIVFLCLEAYYGSQGMMVVFMVNISWRMVVFHELANLEGLWR